MVCKLTSHLFHIRYDLATISKHGTRSGRDSNTNKYQTEVTSILKTHHSERGVWVCLHGTFVVENFGLIF